MKFTIVVLLAGVVATAGAATIKAIKAASAEEILEHVKKGCLKSTGTKSKFAKACSERVMGLASQVDRAAQDAAGQLFVSGGMVELIVEAVPYQMKDPDALFWLLFNFHSWSADPQESHSPSRASIPNQLSSRAVKAGMLDHMQEALTKYPADEKVQFVVLGVIYSVVAGGDFPETEKRREVGTPLLSAVLDAMKRSPQSGIVQHTGIKAIHAIIARNEGVDATSAARSDMAIALGAHSAMMEAIRIHGDAADETHGMTLHEIKGLGTVPVEESIYEVGVNGLSMLVFGDPGNAARARSLMEAAHQSDQSNPKGASAIEPMTMAEVVGGVVDARGVSNYTEFERTEF